MTLGILGFPKYGDVNDPDYVAHGSFKSASDVAGATLVDGGNMSFTEDGILLTTTPGDGNQVKWDINNDLPKIKNGNYTVSFMVQSSIFNFSYNPSDAAEEYLLFVDDVGGSNDDQGLARYRNQSQFRTYVNGSSGTTNGGNHIETHDVQYADGWADVDISYNSWGVSVYFNHLLSGVKPYNADNTGRKPQLGAGSLLHLFHRNNSASTHGLLSARIKDVQITARSINLPVTHALGRLCSIGDSNFAGGMYSSRSHVFLGWQVDTYGDTTVTPTNTRLDAALLPQIHGILASKGINIRDRIESYARGSSSISDLKGISSGVTNSLEERINYMLATDAVAEYPASSDGGVAPFPGIRNTAKEIMISEGTNDLSQYGNSNPLNKDETQFDADYKTQLTRLINTNPDHIYVCTIMQRYDAANVAYDALWRPLFNAKIKAFPAWVTSTFPNWNGKLIVLDLEAFVLSKGGNTNLSDGVHFTDAFHAVVAEWLVNNIIKANGL